MKKKYLVEKLELISELCSTLHSHGLEKFKDAKKAELRGDEVERRVAAGQGNELLTAVAMIRKIISEDPDC